MGIDGEGVTLSDGSHRYVLLSIGDESIMNPDGLDTPDILSFVYGYGCKHPEQIMIGFFLGYDWAYWLRGLSENGAKYLLTQEGMEKRTVGGKRTFMDRPGQRGFVDVRLTNRNYVPSRWWLDMLPHRLAIRRHPTRSEQHRRIRPPTIYVCDTGTFWQKSFMSVIDPSKWPHPICTTSEYEQIGAGKALRASASLDQDMIEYNRLENRILGRVTSVLDDAFKSVGLDIPDRSWYGPGQVAHAWLKRVGGKDLEGETIMRITPPGVWEAAKRSFVAGWFEQPMHGHVGTVYEFDLNSAYPSTISKLPCLLHGQWILGGDEPPAPGTMTLVHAWLRGSSPISGPAPHRLASGRILRPHWTGGWYWLHELEVAHRAGLCDEYKWDMWATYRPCGCPPPLASIADLYQQRLDVGKNTPEGIALKLIYNSTYGKFAQRVGKPVWRNPIYASMITSDCRSRIMEAIGSHPNPRSVTMIATDGVYFTERHPGIVPEADKLGAWDLTVRHGLTQHQPGVWWDDTARDGGPLKTRGISIRDLRPVLGQLDDQWTRWTPTEQWPTLEIPIHFSITSPRLAIARGKWDTAGRIHTERHSSLCDEDCHQGVRLINAWPGDKRNPTVVPSGTGWRTLPHEMPLWETGALEECHPYEAASELDDLERDEMGIDGDITREIMEAMRR